jgi:hypothetical protein
MIIFASDILAGVLIIVSIILLIVAIIAYRRYKIKAAIISTFVFILFFLKGIIYELNALYSWNLNLMEIFISIDVTIMISLYFALALRG